MNAIEKRLLVCRLLEAMSLNPEYAKELGLQDMSIRTANKKKKGGNDHGKEASV